MEPLQGVSQDLLTAALKFSSELTSVSVLLPAEHTWAHTQAHTRAHTQADTRHTGAHTGAHMGAHTGAHTGTQLS